MIKTGLCPKWKILERDIRNALRSCSLSNTEMIDAESPNFEHVEISAHLDKYAQAQKGLGGNIAIQ